VVLEVPKALADKLLEAGIVREEDLEVVHHTVREEVREVRRTGQEEDLEAVRHTVLDVVRQVQCAEVEGSLAEGDHRIGREADLEADLRILPGTAGLVEDRSQADRNLAVGVGEAGHSLVEEEVDRNRLAEAEGRCCSSQTCCSLVLLAWWG